MNFWEFCDRHTGGFMFLAVIVLAIVYEIFKQKLP